VWPFGVVVVRGVCVVVHLLGRQEQKIKAQHKNNKNPHFFVWEKGAPKQ